MLVRSVMKWGNGNVSVRIIDWDDRAAVRDFARASYGCLRDGGMVITSVCEAAQGNEVMDYVDNLKDIGNKLLEIEGY